MRRIVNSRPAGADLDFSWLNRAEWRFPTLENIVQSQGRQFFLHGKQFGAQIPFPTIRKNDDDDPFRHFGGFRGGNKHGSPGTHPRKNSFLPGQTP